MPGWPEQRVRVEAAAYRGRPVFFQMVNPWTQAARMRETPRSRAERWGRAPPASLVITVLAGAALVARHNLRKGRGDRRGALRISSVGLRRGPRRLAERKHAFLRREHRIEPLLHSDRLALFRAGELWAAVSGARAVRPEVLAGQPGFMVAAAGRQLHRCASRSRRSHRDSVRYRIGSGCRAEPQMRPLLGFPAPPPLVPTSSGWRASARCWRLWPDVVFSALFNSLWIVFGLVAINLIVRRVLDHGVVMALFLMIDARRGCRDAAGVARVALYVLSSSPAIVFVMLPVRPAGRRSPCSSSTSFSATPS